MLKSDKRFEWIKPSEAPQKQSSGPIGPADVESSQDQVFPQKFIVNPAGMGTRAATVAVLQKHIFATFVRVFFFF